MALGLVYDAPVRAVVVAVVLAGVASRAEAGGLELGTESPRAIGRAGAQTVSNDSGAALIVNPAAMARRGELRAVVAAGVHDRDAEIEIAGAAGSPAVVDRAGPSLAPTLALHGSLGPLILGAGYFEDADFSRQLPEPTFGQPEDDVARLFPHRYGGSRLFYRRQTAAVGVALRATDWLGVGVALTGSRVELGEERAVWAGFAGRDPLGSPGRDLSLAIRGDDAFVPGASAGVLVAPYQLPLELAIAGSVSAPAELHGDAALSRTRGSDFPAPGQSADAELRLASPAVVRAGLRYLGASVVAEVGAEMTFFPGPDAPSWRLEGLQVTDQTGATGALSRVPALAHRRRHLSARAAVDVQVVEGFLWLTGGYAWRGAAASDARRAPAFADTGGHTVAAGAEAYYEGVTVSVGYARLLAPAAEVSAADTAVEIANPFDAGTGPAAPGRYETAGDQIGLSVEIAWP